MSRALPLVVALLVPALALADPVGGGGVLPGGSDLIGVRTANLLSRGVLVVRVEGDYFESLDASGVFGEETSGEYTTIRLGASYGLATWLEVSADIPARRAAWPEAPGGPRDVTGLDAPVIGVKLALPGGGSLFRLALRGSAGLPVGNEMTVAGESGERLHLGAGARSDLTASLLVTADLSERLPVRLHANVGWAFNRSEDSGRRFFPDYYLAKPPGGSSSDNDALILRGALEFSGRTVDLFTEFRGDLVVDRDLVDLKENALTITPGVRVRFGGGWIATGGVALSISGDDSKTPGFDPHYAYPDWQAAVTLAYAWPVFAVDTDSDGIPDFRDLCPTVAEDFDGFRDNDGCPDPDNDLDGVPDWSDGQPLQMEDYDGFQDDDGVPDLDNDGDGIIDERDMCPDEKEDLDGFEDDDGCPDD